MMRWLLRLRRIGGEIKHFRGVGLILTYESYSG
jgi:hypothetical protein